MSEKEHVKVLTAVRDGALSAADRCREHPFPNEALAIEAQDLADAAQFAISAIEENQTYREMVEAAVTIGFQNDFLTRISPETWVRHSDDEASNGVQFNSALDAYREVKKQGEGNG